MSEESAPYNVVQPLSDEEIAKIRQRTDWASPAPWTAEWGYVGATRAMFLVRGKRFDGVLFGHSHDDVEESQHEADTVFAAHARQDIPRLIATIEARDAKIASLRSEVQEWLCEKCNTVYPGPPQHGTACVICPACGGATGPRAGIERRRLEATIEAMKKKLAEKETPPGMVTINRGSGRGGYRRPR